MGGEKRGRIGTNKGIARQQESEDQAEKSKQARQTRQCSGFSYIADQSAGEYCGSGFVDFEPLEHKSQKLSPGRKNEITQQSFDVLEELPSRS